MTFGRGTCGGPATLSIKLTAPRRGLARALDTAAMFYRMNAGVLVIATWRAAGRVKRDGAVDYDGYVTSRRASRCTFVTSDVTRVTVIIGH
jgi:hypothetical protein